MSIIGTDSGAAYERTAERNWAAEYARRGIEQLKEETAAAAHEHAAAVPMDHPDGSVTLAKLASDTAAAISGARETAQNASSAAVIARSVADAAKTAAEEAYSLADEASKAVQSFTVADGSITTGKLADGAVTSEKLSAIAGVDKLGGIKLHQSGGINRSGLVVDSTGAACVNVSPDYGLSRSGDGKVIIAAASDAEIEAGINSYKPITPKTLKTVTDELSRFVRSGTDSRTIDSNDSEGEGIYHFYGNITNNYPYDTDGVLLQVDVEGLIHQVLFRQDRTIVMRVKTEGTWGAWKDVADDKIYEADISKVGSDNNILYITVPGVTSYDDLNGKTVKLYTGIYSNNKTQTVYVNINGLGAKAIWRATADGTYQNCTYEPYEVNRYTVMELYFTGGTARWVNPPSVITSTEKAELQGSVNGLKQYSATPTRIGTWIDGRPIWRAAFSRSLTEDDKNNITADGLFQPYVIEDFVTDGGSVFIVAERAAICRSVGEGCYIDDIPLQYDGYVDYTHLNTGRLTNFINNHEAPGVYGWVEFVTPESNIIK